MLRAKPVVTPEQARWLESSFDLLGDLFGEDWVVNASLVLPNEKFFPRKYEAKEEWASYAFDRVRELMKVPSEGLFLEFTPDVWDELRESGVPVASRTSGAAGTHQSLEADDGRKGAHITIKRSLLKQPEVMVATMSHELGHVLLLGGGKITRDHEKMEPLTDLMTVFSGFGIFTANAAFIHSSGSRGWRVSRHGYLSEREFGYRSRCLRRGVGKQRRRGRRSCERPFAGFWKMH